MAVVLIFFSFCPKVGDWLPPKKGGERLSFRSYAYGIHTIFPEFYCSF